MDDLWARLTAFEKVIDKAAAERGAEPAHRTSTERGGVGIVLGQDAAGNYSVRDLIPEKLGVPQIHAWTKLRPDEDLTHGRPRQQGSSASACGAIMRGDKIEAIDGTSVRNKSLQDVQAMVAGDAGVSVTFSVSKSSSETLHIALPRRPLPRKNGMQEASITTPHPDDAALGQITANHASYSSVRSSHSPPYPRDSGKAPFSDNRSLRTAPNSRQDGYAQRPSDYPTEPAALSWDGSNRDQLGSLQDELARSRAEVWQLKKQLSNVENSLANSEREKELLHEHLHNLKPIVTPERPDSGWNEGVSVPDRTRHTLTKEKLAQHQARSSPVRRSVIPSSVSACENCGDTPPETFMCGRCHNAVYCSRDCQAKHWVAVHRRQCEAPGSRSSEH